MTTGWWDRILAALWVCEVYPRTYVRRLMLRDGADLRTVTMKVRFTKENNSLSSRIGCIPALTSGVITPGVSLGMQVGCMFSTLHHASIIALRTPLGGFAIKYITKWQQLLLRSAGT